MLASMPDASADLLRRVPLFAGLDNRELKSIAAPMRERTFAAGAKVIEEGQGGAGFFVIESGSATVSVGGRQVRTLGAGDHFGEIALITDTMRTATITAETDLRCWGMTVWEFRPLVESNAEVAWKLLQNLARELGEAEHRA
jgi:CRP/FNR family transcriptional regulator, cyclic AMP receptor protein